MRIESKLKTYYQYSYKSVDSLINQLVSKDNYDNILWIIDKNVAQVWPQLINKESKIIYFESNEESKSFNNIEIIIDKFITYNINSKSEIIAIGGGTLQDAIGFICSIFKRGIKWDFIPTTLLSMIDSCIGGKTSINYKGNKNILGTYYPPDTIHTCHEFIKTLSKNDLNSGYGEIIKFHILCGTTFNKDRDIEILIEWCLSYKRYIVEDDEFDQNIRKYLNYGHTFGHALESTSNYQISHGIAVMMGILIANEYSYQNKFITLNKKQNIEGIISEYLIDYKNILELNSKWFDFNKLIDVVKNDKKNTDTINMILIKKDSVVLHNIIDFVILESCVKNTYDYLINL